jgi:DNA-directed RNA polymerase specialized sigma24 family protein
LDRRPTEGPATTPERDAILETACRHYLAHEAQMLASARNHLRSAGLSHEDPEDVWRDAQLKILDQLSAGRRIVVEPGDTEQDAYVKFGHAVIRLHVNDLRKKAIRRRTDVSDELDTQVAAADVWQQTAHNMALSDWRRALLEKNERTRKVIAMSELGYSRQEIAVALGLSVKRVGKLQEQGKPLRERVLASRGATRLREICAGLGTRVPVPAGVSALVAKSAVGGGIAAMLALATAGGVVAINHGHHKQPAHTTEHAHVARHKPSLTTTTSHPRVTPTPTAPTRAPKPHTIARTAKPPRATQHATTTGTICSTQRVCGTAAPVHHRTHAATTTARTTPARPRPRTTTPPANLCVQQGLCR